MESIGGAALQSTFPPPARTVIGAIRTAIGQAHGVDWHTYPHGPGHQALLQLMGGPDDLGRLSFSGPFLLKGGQRLYPAPLLVLRAQGAGHAQPTFTRLEPSASLTECDLGKVQLPKKQAAALQGAKPLEHTWLTAAGLHAVLAGKTPAPADVVGANTLHHQEERLGIGRDNRARTTQDGLLYQTQHVRPLPDVALGMHVHGLESGNTPVPASGLMRLGAEGRMAHWQRSGGHALPASPAKGNRLVLVLLTHARFAHGWLPDGFEPVQLPSGQTAWEGQLHGVHLRLLCAVAGKPVREGGWNLALRAPRDMEPLTPAGSSYFCEVLTSPSTPAADAVQALHGQHMGQDTAHGRGQMAVGMW